MSSGLRTNEEFHYQTYPLFTILRKIRKIVILMEMPKKSRLLSLWINVLLLWKFADYQHSCALFWQ
jgi:hypothetical protein